MSQKNDGVKPDLPTISTTEDYLKLLPQLPFAWAHLEEEIRALPLDLFGYLVVGGNNDSASMAEIGQMIEQAAELMKHSSHRCAACLTWSDDWLVTRCITQGRYYIVALCSQCREKVDAGQATDAMINTALSYGPGEDQHGR